MANKISINVLLQYLTSAIEDARGNLNTHVEIAAKWLDLSIKTIIETGDERDHYKTLYAKMSPDFRRRFVAHNPRNTARWSVIQSPDQEHIFENPADLKVDKVYFITETPGEEYVKIGHTIEPMYSFISQAQRFNPRIFKLLKVIPGTKATEDWFHNNFLFEWIRGEWFHLTEEILNAKPPSNL